MNLVLIRGGYPPVAVRPQDRLAYIAALQEAPAEGPTAFDRLPYGRLDDALSEALAAARQCAPPAPAIPPLTPTDGPR